MSESNLTLRDLLAPSEKGLSADRRVLMESDPRLQTLKERLAKEAKKVNWDGLSDVLAQKAIELLDVPVLEILLRAWRKYEEVKKLADDHPRGKSMRVPVATHSFESQHRPCLEIIVRGLPKKITINFTVLITMTLDGLLLRIEDGSIKAIETGTLKGKGAFSLESAVLIEKEFGPISLPGTLALGSGIPLRRLREPLDSSEYS